jgi:uncharacterized protein YjbI with pentapeptide repeats
MSHRVPSPFFLPFWLAAVLSVSGTPWSAAQSATPSPIYIAKGKDGSLLTQDDLIEIFTQHLRWQKSRGQEGKEADLKGFYLAGVKLNPLVAKAVEKSEFIRLFSFIRPDFTEFALLPDLDLHGATLTRWDLSDVDLGRANLANATLSWLVAHQAGFSDARFNYAHIFRCNFTEAYFESADLSFADCIDSDFSGARLIKTVFRHARIRGGYFKDADLSLADLTEVSYEPKLNSIPYIPSLATTRGLSELRFETSAAALVELRGALRDAGLRQQEREVNYSIQRQRWRNAKESHRVIEPWFQYVFFDLTCKYGMDPGLPLRILGAGIFVFAIPYLIAILFRKRLKQSGIWAVRIKETVNKPERKTRPLIVAFCPWTASTWGEKLRAAFRAVRAAIFFSLLSAFSIGFREINVRSWISRLQSREYTLRGTGWVRGLAGFQSLLSVYLLGLWILTYFGRPFE